MAAVNGYFTTIQGQTMSMPNACCRCGAPKTKDMGSTVQLGGRRTRTVQLPYCDACHARSKGIVSAQNKQLLLSVGLGLAVALIGVVVPQIPKWVFIVLGTAFAALASNFFRQRAGASVEVPFAAWLTGGTANDTTFFILDQKWAEAFAAANNAQVRPGPQKASFTPWPFALIVAACATGYVGCAGHPRVRVDNAGKKPVQVWVDGKKSIVVNPSEKSSERPTIELPYGKHTFGWSAPDAPAPTEETQPVKIEWSGDHLYNPGRTACYWVTVSTYGSASGGKYRAGPMEVTDVYTFDKMDNWFKRNPSSVSTKSSGAVRVAVEPIEDCRTLYEHGCPVAVREELMRCESKAFGASDRKQMDVCWEQAKRACQKPR